MKLNVATIGSCRVYGPMKESALAGSHHNFYQLFGHTHNPKEILQAFRIISGELVVSQEIGTFMNVNNVRRIIRNIQYKERREICDLFVVEISSLRAINYKEFSFQKNVFSTKLAEAGAPAALIQDLYRSKNVSDTARGQIVALLEPGLLRDIVETAVFRELTEDDVLDHLHKIVAFIGKPVMFVGVVDIFPEIEKTALRSTLTRCLRSFAEGRDDVEFFNPSDFVTKANYETVMRGSAHYQADAIAPMGHHMSARLKAFAERLGLDVRGDSAPPPLAPELEAAGGDGARAADAPARSDA